MAELHPGNTCAHEAELDSTTSRLLELPRALLLDILMRLDNPTNLFAACTALHALRHDSRTCITWFLRHAGERPLPYAVASFQLLKDSPWPETFEFMQQAHALTYPEEERLRRKAQK